MTSIRHSDRHLLIKVLIGEPTVVGVIGLNALALFLDAFPEIHNSGFGLWLEWIDYICIVYFIFEALLKIGLLKFSSYWSSGWNRFDFVIMVASLPLLLNLPFETDSSRIYAIPTLLRMGRFLRFVRVMRFVPNAAHIGQGIMRALQASVGVFLVLFVLNLTLAVGAHDRIVKRQRQLDDRMKTGKRSVPRPHLFDQDAAVSRAKQMDHPPG